MIKILIGGDVCPINRNEEYFKSADVRNIFKNMLTEFNKAELSIVNLECPLIKDKSPIKKTGPVLGVDSECINGLKAANIDVVNLANNHIMDHGMQGLQNTIELCAKAGISTVGAGETINEAGKILIKEVRGTRIGILGVAEHEYSIASHNKPGANPLSLISYVRNIEKHKKQFDYLIVLVHAGVSGYPLPSPQLMDICRFMVEIGANAVICQHSHCPGCYEKYKESYIVYGQGNLIFDLGAKPDSSWNKGFLVNITIEDNGKHSMDITPYIQSYNNAGVRKMLPDEEKLFLREIGQRSSMLSDSNYINQQWFDFCTEKKDLYYFHLLFGFTNNKLFSYLHRKYPIARKFFTKRHRMLLKNIIRCETHREVLEIIFEQET